MYIGTKTAIFIKNELRRSVYYDGEKLVERKLAGDRSLEASKADVTQQHGACHGLIYQPTSQLILEHQ